MGKMGRTAAMVRMVRTGKMARTGRTAAMTVTMVVETAVEMGGQVSPCEPLETLR